MRLPTVLLGPAYLATWNPERHGGSDREILQDILRARNISFEPSWIETRYKELLLRYHLGMLPYTNSSVDDLQRFCQQRGISSPRKGVGTRS